MFALPTVMIMLNIVVNIDADPAPVATVKKVAAAVEVQPPARPEVAIAKVPASVATSAESRRTRTDRLESERPRKSQP
ncbi:MAG TPA: hypothetical protein VGE68_01735 [Sphingomicrobium sp.]